MIRFLFIITTILAKIIFILFWLTGTFNGENDMFNENRTLEITKNKREIINIIKVPTYSTHINFFDSYITYANATLLKKQYYEFNQENLVIEFDGNDYYYKINDTLYKINYTRKHGYTVLISTISEISNDQQIIKNSLLKYFVFFLIINTIWIILGYLYKKKYKSKGDLYFLYFSILLFSFYFIGDVIYIVKMYALL